VPSSSAAVSGAPHATTPHRLALFLLPSSSSAAGFSDIFWRVIVSYFHDLLNIDSPEATLIKDTDKLYSKGSRLASELGGQ
jgi:hypothetical protein